MYENSLFPNRKRQTVTVSTVDEETKEKIAQINSLLNKEGMTSSSISFNKKDDTLRSLSRKAIQQDHRKWNLPRVASL